MRQVKMIGVVGVCVAALACLMALSVPGIARADSTPAAMTNGDVVQLVKLGFGDDVVEAKIQQAPSVAFSLDVGALSQLKAAGVSQPVIAAMLKRSTSQPGPGAGAHNASAFGPRGLTPPVMLASDGQRVELQSVAGSISSSGFIVGRTRSVYPGARAAVRSADRRPVFLLHTMGIGPRGQVFLVSLKVDERAGERSLVIAKATPFSSKGGTESEAQVPVDLVADGQDGWRLSPQQDLAPGEYGVQVLGQLYDFGVDP